jgi:hypothetical protein
MNVAMKSFQIKYSAPQLMAKARELTGIDEVIEPPFEAALESLLHAFNTESQLNERGGVAMEQRVLRLTMNRLCVERDVKANRR